MTETAESKRARRLAARDERQRIAATTRVRQKQRRMLLWIVVGVILVALIAGGIYMLTSQSSPVAAAPGRLLPDEGRAHVTPGSPLTYKSVPPASGTHYDQWLPRGGFFTEPQDPGYWVHNLEHGYVVVLYNCPSDCPELVQQLRGFYEAAPTSRQWGYRKIVIAPYKDMPQKLVALAWARIQEFDGFDQDALMTFYRAWLDKGPENAG